MRNAACGIAPGGLRPNIAVPVGWIDRLEDLRVNRLQDRVANQFGDFGDYGVSAGSNSVHPMGNPINHSWRHGFVREGMYVPRRSAALRELLPPAFDTPLLRGVGKKGRKPKSISDMGGANVGSVYAIPLSMIPERGHITEYSPEPSPRISRKEFWHVLHDCDFRSNIANKPREVSPQPAPLAINTRSAASLGQVLAGKTATDDVDGNSIGSKSCCGKGADVIVAGDVWPVLGKDFARERFDFAESDGFKSACSFKAKAKSPYAAEKVEHAQLLARFWRCNRLRHGSGVLLGGDADLSNHLAVLVQAHCAVPLTIIAPSRAFKSEVEIGSREATNEAADTGQNIRQLIKKPALSFLRYRRHLQQRIDRVRVNHRSILLSVVPDLPDDQHGDAEMHGKRQQRGVLPAHAACSGRALPIDFATSLKCANRDEGIPIDRQLWTVETGASINLATAEVPPR